MNNPFEKENPTLTQVCKTLHPEAGQEKAVLSRHRNTLSGLVHLRPQLRGETSDLNSEPAQGRNIRLRPQLRGETSDLTPRASAGEKHQTSTKSQRRRETSDLNSDLSPGEKHQTSTQTSAQGRNIRPQLRASAEEKHQTSTQQQRHLWPWHGTAHATEGH